MVGVYTRSYTNYRDGAYVDPALKLTSSYVRSNGVRIVGSYQLDDPRGTEGQVLIAPSVKIRSGVTRDLALIADMSNNLYAFNAQPPFNLIWKQPIGNPMTVTKQQDMWGINPFWGVLSTGVINSNTGLWHVVSLNSPDGSYASSDYYFHTVSLADGAEAYPPVPLSSVSYVAPSGQTKQFNAAVRKQRAALTLSVRNGRTLVYVPFGSFAESSDSNLGWVVSLDVTNTPKVVSAWATGDRHIGAGIWMGGAGLSVGDDGSLHGMTGNGGFDPPGDLAESFFKLDENLALHQWWSPYDDDRRAGLDPTLPTETGAERMMERRAFLAKLGCAVGDDDDEANNALNATLANATSNVHKVGDQDLGSGGPLYLPRSLTGYSKNILMGGGKDGILWLLDADAMGNTMPADFRPDRIANNYAHLLFPPWGWTFNGIGQNLMPSNLDELPIAVGGYTRHVHGQPVAYLSPDHGLLTFVQGENGPVRAVSISPAGAPSYVACGTEIASAGMPPPGGMPGGMLGLAVSEQRANTAVLWAAMPWHGDANRQITAGRLVAYGANWVSNGNLIKLWDSADWGINCPHNKFNIVTCQPDKVFWPTYDGRVLIFA